MVLYHIDTADDLTRLIVGIDFVFDDKMLLPVTQNQ
jgi:hypothetical protein